MAGTISQEAFVWSSVAEASRRAIAVRYSLLNYLCTLFYHATTKGDLVMRALAWEFSNDESLKATYSQFLLGQSLLVTPVLTPNSKTVRGVLPGIGQGARCLEPEATMIVCYIFNKGVLRVETNDTYQVCAPLDRITIAGLREEPKGIEFRYNHKLLKDHSPVLEYINGTAYITGLDQYTPRGAFEHGFQLTLTT
ncbi:hypothetical protein G7Z17_g8157 [Cylindrodendrum hubeiense]|uniref:Glycosyl hydrolase family 31 C-terminal domain-containing protein n=1 Tax=Cylindrodendrum hubeiense TaxID=595255 RepID=A0A9P5H1P7_9HYPO|nr:hypothetical protein G7Z17_g8157 [Cylindrodendrum hubeiense]